MKEDITKNQADKGLKEREKKEEEERMQEIVKTMASDHKKKEWYEDNVPKLGVFKASFK